MTQKMIQKTPRIHHSTDNLMTYLEHAQNLYDMIDEGHVMEAFDRYYHDDVIVIEADGERRKGKDAQRTALQEWMSAVEVMHGGETTFVTSNEAEAVTMVQSMADVTMGGRRMQMREVAVQQGEDDQITREEFFYYVPAAMQRDTSADSEKTFRRRSHQHPLVRIATGST